jgi:LAS superfamily LD-carboxypeptidase LdcB
MASVRTLDPLIRDAAAALVQLAREAGLNPVVTSARRSRAEQARLYRNFQAGRSRFPAAPPGRSKHEHGLAFDVHISDKRYLKEMGEVWESWGGRWGGRFKDPIHFEAP